LVRSGLWTFAKVIFVSSTGTMSDFSSSRLICRKVDRKEALFLWSKKKWSFFYIYIEIDWDFFAIPWPVSKSRCAQTDSEVTISLYSILT
jgi:hypothetical protein